MEIAYTLDTTGNHSLELQQEILKELKLFIGHPLLRETWKQAVLLGSLDSGVVLEGLTGTGKSKMAEAIHLLSNRGRNRKPFMRINCGYLSNDLNLARSELFGHTKGSFTGAYENREGLLEVADGGTVLLDDISTLPLEVQRLLLQFLEERIIMPVGSRVGRRVDLRIMVASNESLEVLVRDKKFRSDLFYRISDYSLDLPPLYEMRDVVPECMKHLAVTVFSRTIKFAKESKEILQNHSWPGNFRELSKLLRRLTETLGDTLVRPDDLKRLMNNKVISFGSMDNSIVGSAPCIALPAKTDSFPTLVQWEIDYIVSLMQRVKGNVLAAAKLAGVLRPRIYALCKRHNIKPEDFRPKR
jgi:transcriptional regulator with GAF, ATPase, and Fis domain